MKKPDFGNLKAVHVNCTLKKSPHISHTPTLMEASRNRIDKENAKAEVIRLADHLVTSGVQSDKTNHIGDQDEWPELFKKIIAAVILIVETPFWLDEKSLIAQKLIERPYAISSMTNEKGQYLLYS